MMKFYLMYALLLLLTSCSTTGKFQEIKVGEMSHIIGQWDYDILDNDGNVGRGFFQVEPSDRNNMAVHGQSYSAHSNDAPKVQDLREVWSGTLKHSRAEDIYILTFSSKENPIYPKAISERAHEGTIVLHLKDGIMSGNFKYAIPKDGPQGTIVGRKRQ